MFKSNILFLQVEQEIIIIIITQSLSVFPDFLTIATILGTGILGEYSHIHSFFFLEVHELQFLQHQVKRLISKHTSVCPGG